MSENRAAEKQSYVSNSPEATFEFGEKLGANLRGGEMILLSGGLGAGKTLFTKGILNALDYDAHEVNSPSFTLVNLYKTDKFDVYHLDLWRIDENSDAAFAVGLDEILEDETAVVIIEWAERLGDYSFPPDTFRVNLSGDGDDPRTIEVTPLN